MLRRQENLNVYAAYVNVLVRSRGSVVNQPTELISLLRSAISIIERWRLLQPLFSREPPAFDDSYELLVEVLFDAYTTTGSEKLAWEALEAADSVSMRRMSTLMADNRGKLISRLPSRERQFFMFFDRMLALELQESSTATDAEVAAKHGERIKSMVNERVAFFEGLMRDYPSVAVAWYPRGLSSSQMQQYVQDSRHEGYRYFAGSDYLFGWRLSSGKILFQRLAKLNALIAAVSKFREAIEAMELNATFSEYAEYLFELVIAPLGLPPTGTKLLVVPSGS